MPDHLEHLRIAGRRIGDLARTGDLTSRVPACPGWTLLDVVHHVGEVHRWARLAIVTAAEPVDADIEPPPSDTAALGDWMDEGVDRLLDVLTGLDPEAPTWHPFPTAQRAGVWPRRQAIETTLHRWDAESSRGLCTPIDAALATDAVREYFELVAPRLVARDGIRLPVGVLHLLLEDQLTLITSDGAGVEVTLMDADPRGALQVPPEDLLLALWGRRPLDADGLLAQWLAVGGN